MFVICKDADFTELLERFGKTYLQLPELIVIYKVRGTDNDGNFYLEGLINPHVIVSLNPLLTKEISLRKERFIILPDEDDSEPDIRPIDEMHRKDSGS